jgi:hypothetical protein
VTGSLDNPRSYTVETEGRTLRRNRVQLVQDPKPNETVPPGCEIQRRSSRNPKKPERLIEHI